MHSFDDRHTIDSVKIGTKGQGQWKQFMETISKLNEPTAIFIRPTNELHAMMFSHHLITKLREIKNQMSNETNYTASWQWNRNHEFIESVHNSWQMLFQFFLMINISQVYRVQRQCSATNLKCYTSTTFASSKNNWKLYISWWLSVFASNEQLLRFYSQSVTDVMHVILSVIASKWCKLGRI